MKKDNRKQFQEMVRIKKEQEMFLAKFRSMTPEQQQECVEKLEYDLKYVKAYQADVRDSYYTHGSPQSNRTQCRRTQNNISFSIII